MHNAEIKQSKGIVRLNTSNADQDNFPLFAVEFEDESLGDLILLILVILEFKSVGVAFHSHDLGSIEGRGFRISGKNMFPDNVVRGNGVCRRYRDQG